MNPGCVEFQAIQETQKPHALGTSRVLCIWAFPENLTEVNRILLTHTTPSLWASFFSFTFDAESFQGCIKLKNNTAGTHKCSTQIQQPVMLYQISCSFSLTLMQAFCNIACRGVSAPLHGPFSALFASQTSFNLCVCSPELQYPLVSLVEAGLSLSHPEPQPSTHCP